MSFIRDDEDLTDFECPVCLEYFQLPIYQCTNGHSFCSICTKHMSTCPQCRRSISNTRNYALENLMQRVQVKCEHCSQPVKLSVYSDHVGGCSHGTIECLAPNCNEEHYKKNILAHIRMRHASLLIQNNSILKSHQMTVSCLDVGHNIFWLKRYITEENFMYWFAQAVIPLDKGISYDLTVTIILRTGIRHSLTFPCYENSINDIDFMIDHAVVAFQKSRTQGGKFEVTIVKSEPAK